ncbi:uncharacterized protein N7483_003606 [Penicillium malachiteum]|uniref:uncharacterized protein n=1 Tax=Penicillium malachiteum TaxID=1324776 RepID=UPI002547E10A|nr:uncharacterized protein N7483_003606 [Penicillium malachiteum]KAJ5729098.1 hypothetical protein N7483_003606 [Penicillium malachiteum]
MIDDFTLFNAIDIVPEKVLLEKITILSDNDENFDDSDAENYSHDETWKDEAYAFEERYSDESDLEDDSEKPSISETNTSNTKMAVPHYALCQNCEKEFETDKNSSTACRYHPRRSEPTDEMYVDTWGAEQYEFEIDSEAMREDFPENFEFTCCSATLKDNPHGCGVGLHIDGSAQRDKTAKRARLN